jgi:hypothetical protein
MKINRILALTAGAVALLASCSDFEEINKNPKAASASDLKPYWALDKAIVSDQQNPNDAERVFVLYWGDIARLDGENSSRAVGRSNDEWAGCLYNLTRNCVTSTNNAIKIADDAIASGELGERETGVFNNVKAASRIWRVYLMTEFVDSFGCFTTDFESTSPEYKSVEECYKFMLAELAESVAAIDVNFPASTDAEKKGDPAYQLDPAKWKNFGISMWMRLAMRLSEVEPATAKAEFEKAVAAGPGIRTADGTFRIQEKSGWWDLSGVMSRTWDWLTLSMTTANLMTNLGGAKAEDILKDPGKRFYKNAPLKPEAVAETYGPYIKDASTYLGIHMVDKDGNKTYEANTDSPTWGYFFDGIPSKIDPRAFAYYVLPSDYDNRIETGYANFPSSKAPLMTPIDEANFANAPQFDVSFSWNGLPCGYGYDDLFTSKNALYNSSNGSKLNYGKTYPQLQERYRNNNEYRVFFGPWETYFLLAEAAVRGWNAGMGAQAAYEAGIKASFEYLNVDANYEAYINSEDYNRVGTSVKFTHTAEPQDYTIEYLDPVSNTMKTMTYKYPVASKTLYGKALNDQLTKIITQKFIANTPWLPLENWSDHRRTGLPFWEMPCGSTEFPYLNGWTKTSYQTGQKVGFYAQRMNYPNSFKNANPTEYKHALELMGMTDENTVTPLWWAKK